MARTYAKRLKQHRGCTWAIGDIHGYASILSALLDYTPIRRGDRLVFLGDLIDRGPETPQVLEIIHRLRRQHEVILVRGNHEQMMLKARHDRDARREWLLCDGEATVDAYAAKTMDDIPDVVWELLESTVPYYETDSAIYVHANLDANVELSTQCEHDLYWRPCTYPSAHISGKTMVCGHTFQESGFPRRWLKAICIDTLNSHSGEGVLTALNFEKMAFWQAGANGHTWSDTLEGMERYSWAF